MIVVDRRRVHAPPRRGVVVKALDPITKEHEYPPRGDVVVHDLWGPSPPYPALSSVSDVPRWLAHLVEVCSSREHRKASAIVLWTIDTILQDRGGAEVLDTILADVDVEGITSGAVVALVRGTHHTRGRLPSRRNFLLRARARLIALGKNGLVSGNPDLADL